MSTDLILAALHYFSLCFRLYGAMNEHLISCVLYMLKHKKQKNKIITKTFREIQHISKIKIKFSKIAFYLGWKCVKEVD